MESEAITIQNKAIAISHLIKLDDNEPYNARPFSELIEEEHAANKPYLFAGIETEDSTKKYSHYVDATALNTVLTQNTQPYFKSSETVRNLVNNLLIKKITYYMITKESKETCTQVCTYDEFSNPVVRWNTIFQSNQLSVNANNNNQTPTIALLPANNTTRARLRDTATAQQTITHHENIDLEAAFDSDSSARIHQSPRVLPLTQFLRDIDRCCNAPAHACNKLYNECPENCFRKCMIAACFCANDTACLPVACLCRPFKAPNNPSRNDGFYYLTRWICNQKNIETCCGIDITVSTESQSEAYCGCDWFD